MSDIKKIVLAYSGGLDTSIIIPWLKENYAGAREISNFVDYMWGWQVTVPASIDDAKWEQTFEVYVEDKYDLEVKKFFNEQNPWAYQSVTARMVEAIRKNYWDASEETEKKIVKEYVESVLEYGLSCSDNTCANPLMHKEVIDVAVKFMSPEKIAKLKELLKKTTRKTLDEQMKALKKLKEKLKKGFDEKPLKGRLKNKVEGFKMEALDKKSKMRQESQTRGEWPAALFALFILLLVISGIAVTKKKLK